MCDTLCLGLLGVTTNVGEDAFPCIHAVLAHFVSFVANLTSVWQHNVFSLCYCNVLPLVGVDPPMFGKHEH
jgi:hypothetical protein